MTILTLAQRKIMPPTVSLPFARIKEQFFAFNQKGIITILGIIVILVSVIVYLAALYVTFQTGFSIQESSEQLIRLKDGTVKLEFSLRRKEAGLAEANKELLESMEKISAVKYLTTDHVISLITPKN